MARVLEINRLGVPVSTELKPNGEYIEFAMPLVVALSRISTFARRVLPAYQEGK